MTRLVAFIVGVLVAIFGWMHSPVAFAVPSGVQTFGLSHLRAFDVGR